jgi:glycosyltransferase involved in cell wall biosynthesis
VGEGPERPRLEARYGSTATFHGRASDEQLAALYANACALVVPNVEEFGIAAVEAQAAGRPVLALDAGGTGETVIDGETGVLVAKQDVPAFADAMSSVDFHRFDPAAIRRNAERFAPEQFQRKLVDEVRRVARS